MDWVTPKIYWPDGKIEPLNLWIDDFSKPIELSLICGSFNPLHIGHQYLYYKSSEKWCNTFFELSISNCLKDEIDLSETYRRIKQFGWYAPIIVTELPRYQDKISYLKTLNTSRINFYIGLDVANKLIETEPFDEIEVYDAEFYVSDRNTVYLDKYPANFHFFDGGQKSKGLMEISSTSIRNKNAPESRRYLGEF